MMQPRASVSPAVALTMLRETIIKTLFSIHHKCLGQSPGKQHCPRVKFSHISCSKPLVAGNSIKKFYQKNQTLRTKVMTFYGWTLS